MGSLIRKVYFGSLNSSQEVRKSLQRPAARRQFSFTALMKPQYRNAATALTRKSFLQDR